MSMAASREDDESPAMGPVERHEAVVIGAGPAGLAAAATLQAEGIQTLVLERTPDVGASWRTHYDRLHLHTVRWLSGLPGLSIDRSEGAWVSRQGVVRYLERYARHHRMNIRTGVEVSRLTRDEEGWRLHTSAGDLLARSVVVATGFNNEPFLPEWPGRDSFEGALIHSASYRNPKPYVGRSVLVVGTGNSGAEIAVDLVEGGAGEVSISVRTPPNILRRDLGGLPTQAVGVLLRPLPTKVTDQVAALTQRLTVGDLTKYGMPAPTRGLYTRAKEDSIPILDVGLIRMLKKGQVKVVPAVEGFERSDVLLAGGRRVRPDAVIAATGFKRGLESLVGELGLVSPSGRPVVHGAQTHPGAPGLYFIGFTNPISGNLRELGIDGKQIAKAVGGSRQGAGSGERSSRR